MALGLTGRPGGAIVRANNSSAADNLGWPPHTAPLCLRVTAEASAAADAAGSQLATTADRSERVTVGFLLSLQAPHAIGQLSAEVRPHDFSTSSVVFAPLVKSLRLM